MGRQATCRALKIVTRGPEDAKASFLLLTILDHAREE